MVPGGVEFTHTPDDYSTFRLGMFGLDKLYDIDGTVNRLEAVLDDIV